MAVLLDEQMMGFGADVIGFPHLLICLGFVVLHRDDTGGPCLSGMHLTDVAASARAFPLFQKRFDDLFAETRIDAIYGCGNWDVRYAGGDKAAAWRLEMERFAHALHFHGPARGFNTGIIVPRDGTYVEYDVNSASPQPPVRIFYRQNDKMTFKGNGPGQPMAKFSDTTLPPEITDPELIRRIKAKIVDRVEDSGVSKSSPQVKWSWKSGKRELAEVDYAQRLEEQQV